MSTESAEGFSDYNVLWEESIRKSETYEGFLEAMKLGGYDFPLHGHLNNIVAVFNPMGDKILGQEVQTYIARGILERRRRTREEWSDAMREVIELENNDEALQKRMFMREFAERQLEGDEDFFALSVNETGKRFAQSNPDICRFLYKCARELVMHHDFTYQEIFG